MDGASPNPRKSPAADPSAPGRATPAGTHHYAARFQGRTAAGHFREAAGGLFLSSIGIGTYLGEADAATDRGYRDSIVAAMQAGANVFDSAINYRFQRSERSIGAALRDLFALGYSREEFLVCTKAGFLTPDGELPADLNEYFAREYVARGIFGPEDIAAGCHCLAPAYLQDQLARSLRNLGLATLDVFYLHNPETQLTEIPMDRLRPRLRDAFVFLESAVLAGKIGAYGLATWNAFRDAPGAPGYLSLADVEALAREAGGEQHHLRFVQLPFNLAMPEALTRANQTVAGRAMPMVQAAHALGITFIASAPLLQGQLARNLPAWVREGLGIQENSAAALQFARSCPGITTALVGMSRAEHTRMNLALATVEGAPREKFRSLFAPRASGPD